MIKSGMEAFTGPGAVEEVVVIVAPGTESERSAGRIIDATVGDAMLEGKPMLVDLWGEDSPGVRPSIGEELVGEALLEFAEMATDGFVGSFLLREVPTVADVMNDVLRDLSIKDRIVVVTPDGQLAGNTNLPRDTDGLLTAVVPSTERLPVGDNVIRRRGVHRSLGPEANPSYYLFQYDLLPDGERAVVAAFMEFFRANGPHLVIFDASNSSDWFSSWVLRAAFELRLPCVDVHDLTGSSKRTVSGSEPFLEDRVSELLESDDTVVALLSASVDSGATLARMLDSLKVTQRANARLLSVFGNESRSSTRPHADREGGQSVFQVGKEEHTVEYLVGVTFRPLSVNDWKVAAAVRMGEVIETRPSDGSFYGENSLEVTRTSIWSLLEDLGASREKQVPGHRTGVSHFPDLASLDPYDAHWVAEAVVERMVIAGNRVRGSLVFIVPDQDTGALHLASALRLRCDVEVVRGVIDTGGDASFSAEDVDRLEMLRASHFVAFDESAVTYGTLRALSRAFESVLLRGVEHHAVVVDLGPPETKPSPFTSLIAWQPFGRTHAEVRA